MLFFFHFQLFWYEMFRMPPPSSSKRVSHESSRKRLSPPMLSVCRLWTSAPERRSVCRQGRTLILSTGLREGVRPHDTTQSET